MTDRNQIELLLSHHRHSYRPENGYFTSRAAATECKGVIDESMLRIFGDRYKPVMSKVEGKKKEYTIEFPRIKVTWWPQTPDIAAVVSEIKRIYETWSDEFN